MQDGHAWQLKVGVPADLQDQTRYVSYGPSDAPYPAVFIVNTQNAIAFGQDATRFRDPRIVRTPRNLIHLIKLTEPSGRRRSFTFERNGSGIHTLETINTFMMSLDRAAVAEFLNQLTTSAAIEFVTFDATKHQLLLTAVLHPRLGGEKENFSIYEDSSSERTLPTLLIHRSNEPVALRVPRTVIEPLLDPKPLLKPGEPATEATP